MCMSNGFKVRMGNKKDQSLAATDKIKKMTFYRPTKSAKSHF